MNFLQHILLCVLTVQMGNAYVFAQYMLEVLKTSFGVQQPVFRCEATGANFGPDVQEFSGSNKAVGCALFADPRNACGPVHFKPPNTTVYCDTYFAVVARGNCSFSEKAFNVQTAEPFGFDALIVYNEMNKGGPIPMSGSIHAQDVTIPSVMINHACMKEVMTHYSSAHGYSVTMKASPGYYDLIKYLVPFVVIVGFCFIILFISLIIRLCRERRRLSKKRLSRANLKKIPIKKFKKGEDTCETCAVCLEDFVENEKIRVLLCRHAYHQKCIDPWLTKNRKVCPICKRKVGPSTGDSDSETEQNTVNNSIATSSRDNEPLLTNVYNNTNQASSSRPSILNIRWLTRGNQNTTNTQESLPTSTAPTPNYPSTSDLPEETNDENRRPVVQRVSSAVSRAFGSLRRKFTRTDSNAHRRLENDDTLSTIILDSDIENPAHSSRSAINSGEDNVAYANSSADGTSLTTVHSNQYCVQAEVEPTPNDPE